MSTYDLIWVETIGDFGVALTKEVGKAFESADPKARARILRHMEHFASGGRNHLNREAFVFEGRFSGGIKSGQKFAVSAFKAWKVRVYGCVTNLGERTTFVGTEIDLKKKQNRANPAVLRRAAQKMGGIDEK